MDLRARCDACRNFLDGTNKVGERRRLRQKMYYHLAIKRNPELLVYREVFEALASYNIKFKAEFNYLDHHLYQKTTNSADHGLRTGLLVEVELEDQEKPLTVVIEVQG